MLLLPFARVVSHLEFLTIKSEGRSVCLLATSTRRSAYLFLLSFSSSFLGTSNFSLLSFLERSANVLMSPERAGGTSGRLAACRLCSAKSSGAGKGENTGTSPCLAPRGTDEGIALWLSPLHCDASDCVAPSNPPGLVSPESPPTSDSLARDGYHFWFPRVVT